MTLRYTKARNIDEALTHLDAGHKQYEYAVAWIDCLASGRSLGRAIVVQGNHADHASLPRRLQASPLRVPDRRAFVIPFYCPQWLLGGVSVRAFNELYYLLHHSGESILDYDRFFFPLDRVCQWNRAYGRRGLVQYHGVIPRECASRGCAAVLESIQRAKVTPPLAVLKATGESNSSPLSFPIPGFSLACDFPRSECRLTACFREMDAILVQNRGRIYLAKDSRLHSAEFNAMYPMAEYFAAVKAEVDPCERFASSQSRRLGLTAQQ